MRRDTLFADRYRRELLVVTYERFPDRQSLLMQKPTSKSPCAPIVELKWPALLRRKSGDPVEARTCDS